MNTTEFLIWFQHGIGNMALTVYAFSEQEARILAQAERIKDGLTYEVLRVEVVKRKEQ